jgi:diacylglycerol kinase (ATP)
MSDNLKKRALLLVNRHSRRGADAVSDAVNELQNLGFELLEESTAKPQQISEIIYKHRNNVDLVIIGGGDGTLNAAAEGLVDTKLPLGILPMGTANDLARTLSISSILSEACQIIATGKIQQIDLGCVNDKHFFNVASMGLSVEITRQLNKEVKQKWGVLAYALVAMQVVRRSRPFKATITINGEKISVSTVQIAVGNGRFYGGGMVVAEDATINDQRLDLYSLELDHWWQIMPILPAMWQGNHEQWQRVRSLQGQEIEIHTQKPRAISADGEIVTKTPAKFRLVPQAVSVFVPETPIVPT